VIESLHSAELSLSDRLLLLPIALRHQLATGRLETALSQLENKLQLADMLDSRISCLVHVLLAEASAQVGQSERHRYLYSRAALLADVDSVVQEQRQRGFGHIGEIEHGAAGISHSPSESAEHDGGRGEPGAGG
jgi:hypothetical protein